MSVSIEFGSFLLVSSGCGTMALGFRDEIGGASALVNWRQQRVILTQICCVIDVEGHYLWRPFS